MKILAIRGSDLASLAGEFRVELEKPPLDRAGLFAISGPTGSGKSTLLDALCLALFDRMPRLPEDRGHMVGRAGEDDALRIRSTDVRAVLRRGAGEGWAEVDFVGVDGRRYRARWGVWRARRRPDGRLQDAVVSLTDLESGQQLGTTKTETLDFISERLGLTFDQFRRSVLLAQGDFAAFLKAAGKERAELLERVTGTGLYAELSRSAYQRAVEERQGLEQLEQRLGEVAALDDEGRERLEEELAGRRTDLEAAAQRREATRLAAAWHDRREELATAVAGAAEAVTQARSHWEEASPRREELARVRRVQGLRRPAEEADRAAAELDRRRTEGAAAGVAASTAEAAATARRQEAGSAAAALAEARTAAEAARPQLARARTLDAALTSAAARCAELQTEETAQRERAAAAARRLEEARRQRTAAEEQETAAAEWLAARDGLAPVAAQWERWRAELDRLVRLRDERDDATDRLRATAAEMEALVPEEQGIGAAAAETAAASRAAEEAVAVARSAVAEGPDESDVRRRLRTSEGRRERLRRAVEVAQRAERARDERNAAAKESTELAAQGEADCAERQRLDREAAEARAALEEARRAHELAVAAASAQVEALRRALAPGEPCPVCGATEHPWGDGARTAGLAAAHAARVSELEILVGNLAEEQGRVEAHRSAVDQRRRELKRWDDDLAAELADLAREWEEAASDLGLPVVAGAEEVVTTRADQEAELADLAAADEEAAQLRLALERARSNLDAAREAGNAAEARLRELKDRRRELEEARSVADATRARAQRGLDEALATLAEPMRAMTGWRKAAERAPQGLADELARKVDAWRAHQAAQIEAAAAVRELAVGEEAAAAEAENANRALAGASAAAASARAGQDRLHAERTEVLGGRRVEAVEEELAAAVGEAESTAETARQALSAAERDLAVAQREVERAHGALSEAATGAEAARSMLAEALADRGVDEAEVRRLLSHPASWIEDEEAALSTLERQLTECDAVLVSQRRLLEAHESSERPQLDAAAAREEEVEAESVWEAAYARVATLEERVAEDDRRRARAAELHRKLSDQAARTRVWEELRELIGSADGSKLRVFAQSLTLDVLLAHANQHLADLARRYRLERVPGSELELQVVDRDLGDEVRSVHSLSGGESFLVSLALALGLASLSSRRTRVDSLFVDEGFGSLDIETLDTALAVLDALQAQGRTVGVISHVPTLVERIGLQVRVIPRGGGRSAVVVARDGGDGLPL